jgi:hypothetical protein
MSSAEPRIAVNSYVHTQIIVYVRSYLCTSVLSASFFLLCPISIAAFSNYQGSVFLICGPEEKIHPRYQEVANFLIAGMNSPGDVSLFLMKGTCSSFFTVIVLAEPIDSSNFFQYN